MNYLPIGTLVRLDAKELSIYSVIAGYCPQNEKGEQMDYVGINYPFGVMDNSSFLFFNEEGIGEIIQEGYKGSEYERFVQAFKEVMKTED